MKKPPTSWMQPDPRQPLPAHARPGDRAKPATTPTPGHPVDSGPMLRPCPSCRQLFNADWRRCPACGEQSAPITVAKTTAEVIRAADQALFWASYEIGRMDRQHADWLAAQQSPEVLRKDAEHLAKIRAEVDKQYADLWRKHGWNGVHAGDTLRKDADGAPSLPKGIKLFDDDRSDK
jgi:hypothetical protein